MGKRSRHFRLLKKKSIDEVEREKNRAIAASLLTKLEDIKMLKENNDGHENRAG